MQRSTSRSRTRTLACVLVVVGLVSAVACGSDDDDGAADATSPTTEAGASGPSNGDPLAPQPLAERTEITIGVAGKAFSFLPILMADELGAFEEENLDVKIEVLPPNDVPLLLSQGTVDAAAYGLQANALNLISSGADIRMVLPYEPEFADESESGVWVRKDVLGDDGFQAEDLSDVQIASAAGIGPSLAYLWYEELRPEGIPASDVTVNVLPYPDAAVAIGQGSIDATIMIPPFTGEVRDSGCCEYVGGNPPFPNAWFMFGDRLLNDDRDAGLAVNRAIARTATDYLSGDFLSDPEKLEAIARVLEIPEESVTAQGEVTWDLTTADPEESLDVVQEMWLERDDILSYTEPLSVDDVFDMGFYEQLFPEG